MSEIDVQFTQLMAEHLPPVCDEPILGGPFKCCIPATPEAHALAGGHAVVFGTMALGNFVIRGHGSDGSNQGVLMNERAMQKSGLTAMIGERTWRPPVSDACSCDAPLPLLKHWPVKRFTIPSFCRTRSLIGLFLQPFRGYDWRTVLILSLMLAWMWPMTPTQLAGGLCLYALIRHAISLQDAS